MRSKTLNNFDLDYFERFYDDLCELLLSFLSISDKISSNVFPNNEKVWYLIENKNWFIIYSEENKCSTKGICYGEKLVA
jgi:hypothetical protein